MTYRVDQASDTPPSRQIVEAVLDTVARGALAAGDRLPSVRAMAADALVNPNTVARAYRELEVLGVAAGRNGLGVFITADGPARARAERGRATLVAFARAAAGALRAGHDIEDLREALRRAREEAGEEIEA